MDNIKKILATSIFLLFFALTGQSAVLAYNFSTDSGLDTTATGAGYDTNSAKTPESLAGEIIQIALSFLGVLFLGLTIYAGFTWMTAKGNEQQVEKAKDMLIESITGLIIVIAAYAIASFVYNYFGTID